MRERGQAVVEFSLLIVPFVLLALGSMTVSWLLLQNVNVSGAAQAAAREAVLTSNWTTSNGTAECASSGLNIAIEAQGASPMVPINPGELCNSTVYPNVYTQVPVAGRASIQVVLGGTPSKPTSFDVTVSFPVHPLAVDPQFSTTLVGHSTLEAYS